jgi:uncharacterized protein
VFSVHAGLSAPIHPSLRSLIDFSRTKNRLERHPETKTREVGMSLAVYDVIVPTMLHGLYVLDNFLDHAQTLERSKRMDPGTVLEARLAPDMLTFGEQFSVGCNKVEAHVVKLLGRDCPAPRAVAMMYPALKGRLVETRGFLQGLRPDEFDGAQSRTYELTPVVA